MLSIRLNRLGKAHTVTRKVNRIVNGRGSLLLCKEGIAS